MENLSKSLGVNVEEISKQIKGPNNRGHVKGEYSPINVLAHPTVLTSLGGPESIEYKYTFKLLIYVSTKLKRIENIRSELGDNQQANLSVFDPNDSDYEHDNRIIRILFQTGLYRTMKR